MRTRLAWCFLILCAAWYTYDTILTQFPTNSGSDFEGYYSAARHVLHGRSPFLEDSYIYPPLLALLMAPLGGANRSLAGVQRKRRRNGRMGSGG